jgi:diaminohydroxyphosphoribosylaminopyrimidine deaminase/5-amino-6-(5-phosphoribosylamino)uracil reductase
VVVATTTAAAPEAAHALEALGAEVLPLGDKGGRVDLRALLAELGRRGIGELHVEAGERLNAALLEADLVDEWLVYLAPLLIGPGRSMVARGPLAQLGDASRLDFLECIPCGSDLRIRAREPGRADFAQPAARALRAG